MTGARIAVDIGGTFTDAAIEVDGRVLTTKVLTTYPNPEDGFLAAVTQGLQQAGIAAADVTMIIHGTTLATNSLIERRGAKVAFVTTAGFRDVIEIGTESRFALYDLFIQKPEPLVPRPLRFDVPERLSVGGDILTPLDEGAVEALADVLRREQVEAVAIGFLHAYGNPAHEIRAEEILRARLGPVPISRAAEVSSEIREYERFSTVCANAYVRPMVERYLDGLGRELGEAGLRCPLFIITSSGGMTTVEVAKRFPVRLIESGPAGGAVLAANLARAGGLDRVMSFDMGGTTAKICFIDDGEPSYARSFEAARVYRFVKGSGLPLRIPVIEMVEIGAGGGSIAQIDRLERLTVGPMSASSVPGPACYDRGGTEPTVTDADLIAGRIDPGRFAGGSIRLAPERAGQALGELGRQLGLGPEEAALAVMQVVEENMASAARVHATENGRDIEAYTMVAFGGAAPIHAAYLAEKLGIGTVIVPPGAGVGSAIGFLQAPVSFDLAMSWMQATGSLDMGEANARLNELAGRARSIVALASSEAPVETRRALMRYRGQGHEIEVALPARDLTPDDRNLIEEAFVSAYRQLYGRVIPGLPTEILTWLVSVRAAEPSGIQLDCAPPAGPERGPSAGSFLDVKTAAPLRIEIVERGALRDGAALSGPAAVVEDETTTIVPPRWTAAANARGEIVLRRGPG